MEIIIIAFTIVLAGTIFQVIKNSKKVKKDIVLLGDRISKLSKSVYDLQLESYHKKIENNEKKIAQNFNILKSTINDDKASIYKEIERHDKLIEEALLQINDLKKPKPKTKKRP